MKPNINFAKLKADQLVQTRFLILLLMMEEHSDTQTQTLKLMTLLN